MQSCALQSNEGARLVETQVQALFGDLKMLQDQMQQAVGQDATSMEDLMQRVQVGLCSVTAVAAGAFLACIFLSHRGHTLCVLALLHRLQPGTGSPARHSTVCLVWRHPSCCAPCTAADWPLLTLAAPPLVQLTFLQCTALHGLEL